MTTYTTAARGYVGAGPRYTVHAAQRQSAIRVYRGEEQGRLLGGARSVVESGCDVEKVRTAQQI